MFTHMWMPGRKIVSSSEFDLSLDSLRLFQLLTTILLTLHTQAESGRPSLWTTVLLNWNAFRCFTNQTEHILQTPLWTFIKEMT